MDVDNEELEGWPLPGGVPGLITDLVLSMDDRNLFFSNWSQARLTPWTEGVAQSRPDHGQHDPQSLPAMRPGDAAPRP